MVKEKINAENRGTWRDGLMIGIGYGHAAACAEMDKHLDPRQQDMATIIDKAIINFNLEGDK